MLFRSNDTATTEIYTLSLHDALPICKLRLVLLKTLLDASNRDRDHDARTLIQPAGDFYLPA